MARSHKIYRLILLILVVSAVSFYVYKNLGDILSYNFQIRWVTLVFAYLINMSMYVISFFIWLKVTSSFNLDTACLKAARAWFLSHLGKYVPGKVTLLLIRLEAYGGESKRKVAASTFVEYFSILSSSCIVALIAFTSSSKYLPSYVQWISICGAVLFLLLLWPPLFKFLIAWGFRLFRKEPITEVPAYSLILKFVISYTIPMLLQGFSFFLVVRTFIPIPGDQYLSLTGIYFAATITGLISFFTPNGLGVKEGILFIALQPFMAKPVAIVGTLTYRLVQIASEGSLALLSSMIFKIGSRSQDIVKSKSNGQ